MQEGDRDVLKRGVIESDLPFYSSTLLAKQRMDCSGESGRRKMKTGVQGRPPGDLDRSARGEE